MATEAKVFSTKQVDLRSNEKCHSMDIKFGCYFQYTNWKSNWLPIDMATIRYIKDYAQH